MYQRETQKRRNTSSKTDIFKEENVQGSLNILLLIKCF